MARLRHSQMRLLTVDCVVGTTNHFKESASQKIRPAFFD